MASASVKVAVRVRPMAAKELLANSSECVSCIPGTTQLVVGGSNPNGNPNSITSNSDNPNAYWMTQKSFTFDHIFDQLTSQESLYRDSVAPLVERFLEGFNATVLAYGQTGSGKTFSMGIGLESVNTPANTQQGIVPRAVSEIFARIRQTAERDGDAFRAQVLVAFLELYNEELVDLLNPRPRTANLPASSAPTIREDGTGKIVWLNVREEEVKSPEELLGVLQRGTLCRTTGSTDMNATSSRSHAIFTVTLRQEKKVNSQPPSAPPVANDDAASTAMVAVAASASTTSLQTIVSKFHFVDLAGSERLKRTNAEGDRKKEGISINQGLLALGNVISALGDETRKAGHVPYRDSKLTRMLQDSLGGNSQTLMLACVSPSDLNYSETVNTLHYANRARNIKNRVVINQEWFAGGGGGIGGAAEKDREIKSLRQTVSQLRTELAMLRATGTMGLAGSDFASASGAGTGGTGVGGMAGRAVPGVSAARNAGGARGMANGLDQKEAQFYMRRERDLMTELDMYKSTQQTIRFSMERLQFRCSRLTGRVRELMAELETTTMERDAALIEKSRLLQPGLDLKLRVKGDEAIVAIGGGGGTARAAEAHSRETHETSSTAVEDLEDVDVDADVDMDDIVADIDDDAGRVLPKRRQAAPTAKDASALRDVHPVVQSYVTTISALRVQLTEMEDKLAWHTEAMSKIGRRGSRLAQPMLAWTEAEDKELGIPSGPTLRVFQSLSRSHGETEIAHEKSLVKGLKENPDILGMLDSADDAGDARIAKSSSGFSLTSAVSKLSPMGSNEPITLAGLEQESETSLIDEQGAAGGGNGGGDLDMYVLINKIQNDIAEHEALVDRIHRRDAEYEVMQKAYEQKLHVLQSQLGQFQRERDEALKRMQDGVGGGRRGDKGGTAAGSLAIAAAKSKYEEEKRKIDSQIAEYRRKIGENSRMQSSSRTRGDLLTKELQSTIEALKAEKARMLKELRKEAQRNRDMSTASQREIARLRRKERAAAEATKRLERSNQLQRVMLKKRNEEVAKSQSKLRNVLQLLKRSSTPNRVFKMVGSSAGGASGSSSPSGKRSNASTRPGTARDRDRDGGAGSNTHGGHGSGGGGGGMRRVLSGTEVSEFLAGVGSPMKVSASDSLALMAKPSIQVRAQFKKQMVDKELATCVLVRRTQAALDDLKAVRQRLLGEQRELIAERNRVVQAEYERTGLYDASAPQYMDERLQAIDVEIGGIDVRMSGLEDLLRMHATVVEDDGGDVIMPSSGGGGIDLSWDNALNLMRSLDRLEMEAVIGLVLDDVVGLRVAAEDAAVRSEERENVVSELKRMVEVLRTAALSQSQVIEQQRREAEAAVRASGQAVAAARSGGSLDGVSVTLLSGDGDDDEDVGDGRSGEMLGDDEEHRAWSAWTRPPAPPIPVSAAQQGPADMDERSLPTDDGPDTDGRRPRGQPPPLRTGRSKTLVDAVLADGSESRVSTPTLAQGPPSRESKSPTRPVPMRRFTTSMNSRASVSPTRKSTSNSSGGGASGLLSRGERAASARSPTPDLGMSGVSLADPSPLSASWDSSQQPPLPPAGSGLAGSAGSVGSVGQRQHRPRDLSPVRGRSLAGLDASLPPPLPLPLPMSTTSTASAANASAGSSANSGQQGQPQGLGPGRSRRSNSLSVSTHRHGAVPDGTDIHHNGIASALDAYGGGSSATSFSAGTASAVAAYGSAFTSSSSSSAGGSSRELKHRLSSSPVRQPPQSRMQSEPMGGHEQGTAPGPSGSLWSTSVLELVSGGGVSGSMGSTGISSSSSAGGSVEGSWITTGSSQLGRTASSASLRSAVSLGRTESVGDGAAIGVPSAAAAGWTSSANSSVGSLGLGTGASGGSSGGSGMASTMGGLDVFARLANAHTLASQAKVITRTVERDGPTSGAAGASGGSGGSGSVGGDAVTK